MRDRSLVLVLVAAVLVLQAEAEQFNSNIPWMTTKAELEELQNNGPHDKPTLVLISKQWCGACKRLKQLFNSGSSEAKEVENLAKEFNMMSLADDQEPVSDEWAPDGGYVPRMYFLDKDGKMMAQYNKQGNPKYKYFYSELTHVKAAMRNVLRTHNEL